MPSRETLAVILRKIREIKNLKPIFKTKEVMKFPDLTTYEDRWRFYVKYFLPIFLIFFFWVLIGNLIEQNYKKDNLTKITGRVVNVNEAITTKRKNSNDYELRIYLNNYPQYFRILDNFKYENIQKKIKIGDEVQIYFRPKYLVPLGMGRQTDIYQLENKNEILLDISERKRKSKGSIVISLISIIVFGALYYFGKRKIKSYC